MEKAREIKVKADEEFAIEKVTSYVYYTHVRRAKRTVTG